jgi:hypothetical protein
MHAAETRRHTGGSCPENGCEGTEEEGHWGIRRTLPEALRGVRVGDTVASLEQSRPGLPAPLNWHDEVGDAKQIRPHSDGHGSVVYGALAEFSPPRLSLTHPIKKCYHYARFDTILGERVNTDGCR